MPSKGKTGAILFLHGKKTRRPEKEAACTIKCSLFCQEGTAPIQNPLIVAGKSQFGLHIGTISLTCFCYCNHT